MTSWPIWTAAFASVTACIFLWFREARRIMRERKSTVESAAEQLAACRQKASGVRYAPELAKVLMRSEIIYLQAVELYHQTLRKPWIWLPATLMRFRPIPNEDYYTLGRNRGL